MDALTTCRQLVDEINGLEPSFFLKRSRSSLSSTTTSGKGLKKKPSWLTLKRKEKCATTATTLNEDLNSNTSLTISRISGLRRWLTTVLFHPQDTQESDAAAVYKSHVRQCVDLLLSCAQSQFARLGEVPDKPAAALAAVAPKNRFSQLVRKFSSKSDLIPEDGNNEEENDEDEEDDLGEEREDDTAAMDEDGVDDNDKNNNREDECEDESAAFALATLADICGIQTCLAELSMSGTLEPLILLCQQTLQSKRALYEHHLASRCLKNVSHRADCLKLFVSALDQNFPRHALHFGLDPVRYAPTLKALSTLTHMLAPTNNNKPWDDVGFYVLNHLLVAILSYGELAFLLEKAEQDEILHYVKIICDTLNRSSHKRKFSSSKQQYSAFFSCLFYSLTIWAAISKHSSECLLVRKQLLEKHGSVEAFCLMLLKIEAKNDSVYKRSVEWREQMYKGKFLVTAQKTFAKFPVLVQYLVKIQPDFFALEYLPQLPSPLWVNTLHHAVLVDCVLFDKGALVAASLERFLPSSCGTGDWIEEEERELNLSLTPPSPLPGLSNSTIGEETEKLACLVLPMLSPLNNHDAKQEDRLALFALHPSVTISSTAKQLLTSQASIQHALEQADFGSPRTLELLDLLQRDSVSAKGVYFFHVQQDAQFMDEEVLAYARTLSRGRLRLLLRTCSSQNCKMTGALNRNLFGALNCLVLSSSQSESGKCNVEFQAVFGDLLSDAKLASLPIWVVNRIGFAFRHHLRQESFVLDLLTHHTVSANWIFVLASVVKPGSGSNKALEVFFTHHIKPQQPWPQGLSAERVHLLCVYLQSTTAALEPGQEDVIFSWGNVAVLKALVSNAQLRLSPHNLTKFETLFADENDAESLAHVFQKAPTWDYFQSFVHSGRSVYLEALVIWVECFQHVEEFSTNKSAAVPSKSSSSAFKPRTSALVSSLVSPPPTPTSSSSLRYSKDFYALLFLRLLLHKDISLYSRFWGALMSSPFEPSFCSQLRSANMPLTTAVVDMVHILDQASLLMPNLSVEDQRLLLTEALAWDFFPSPSTLEHLWQLSLHVHASLHSILLVLWRNQPLTSSLRFAFLLFRIGNAKTKQVATLIWKTSKLENEDPVDLSPCFQKPLSELQAQFLSMVFRAQRRKDAKVLGLLFYLKSSTSFDMGENQEAEAEFSQSSAAQKQALKLAMHAMKQSNCLRSMQFALQWFPNDSGVKRESLRLTLFLFRTEHSFRALDMLAAQVNFVEHILVRYQGTQRVAASTCIAATRKDTVRLKQSAMFQLIRFGEFLTLPVLLQVGIAMKFPSGVLRALNEEEGDDALFIETCICLLYWQDDAIVKSKAYARLGCVPSNLIPSSLLQWMLSLAMDDFFQGGNKSCELVLLKHQGRYDPQFVKPEFVPFSTDLMVLHLEEVMDAVVVSEVKVNRDMSSEEDEATLPPSRLPINTDKRRSVGEEERVDEFMRRRKQSTQVTEIKKDLSLFSPQAKEEEDVLLLSSLPLSSLTPLDHMHLTRPMIPHGKRRNPSKSNLLTDMDVA